MIGVDALYVAARRILLDVLEALGPHRPKFVLVGAQAVYLQAGDADMEVVAPYTKDADLGIDARDLDRDPSILGLMTAAGDVVRLMRGSATPDAVGKTLAKLAGDEMCGPSVRAGVDYLERLFATPRARGVDLAVENVTGAIREDEVRALMPNYLAVLLAAYRRWHIRTLGARGCRRPHSRNLDRTGRQSPGVRG